jgi:CBS domain-containing protein
MPPLTGGDMNVKVYELMTESVVTTEPHATADHVRRILERNGIGAIPVVDSDARPVGIVSSTDFVAGLNPSSPVKTIMTGTAARIMRNHGIHRVVVTHEQKVVGILSSFDLLKLVEDRRFVAKNAPTTSSRKGSKRT